jgi:hypothetical protein
MDDSARELALVRQALTSGLSNCVEWVSDQAARLVRNNPANQGLTPEGIKRLVRGFVKAGGQVEQRVEGRTPWKHARRFWYMVIVPVDGFPDGLFVEMELLDADPEVPMVALLNAHPEPR